MNKSKIALAAVLTAISTAALADEDVVGTREKSFTVIYPNHTKETYVVRYKAIVDYGQWQDGHPSEPLKGDFTDTRQCHWNISTSIVRDVCLTSASGQQFCQGNLSRVYGTSFAGKGSDFKVLALRPENCGDAAGRYASDVNDAKNKVNDALNGVVQNDAPIVSSDLAATTKAASVKPI